MSSHRSTRYISVEENTIRTCADVYDRRLSVCRTCMQTCITCMAVQMVTSELRYEYIMCSFLIDECRITESFSGYIVNFVKHVRSTSPYMMLVDEELYAVQAWKKAF
ncbi:hypothetical protein TNCV_3270161 [Trichonephila clavipes]|uniref:Uncharacterized protein n=1 Tax=Trichonephila clavipes TaxID=2585209 RepID=A0A8X6S1K0_TRICX|nr:hypothetical protein TNCV_3270161 [Trichonephila clavipes]